MPDDGKRGSLHLCLVSGTYGVAERGKSSYPPTPHSHPSLSAALPHNGCMWGVLGEGGGGGGEVCVVFGGRGETESEAEGRRPHTVLGMVLLLLGCP